MLADTPSPPEYRRLGAGAVLLLGALHTFHDLTNGEAPTAAVLSTVSIALQIATLSIGHAIAVRRRWPRSIAVALAVVVSVGFGYSTATLHERWTLERASIVRASIAGSITLAFWGLVFYFPPQLSRARMRALAAESEHRKAELARLRSMLHPHFLLNTLNAISGLLVVEPEQARLLVSALGDLLRDSLEDSGEMRPVAEEVAWLERYAQIFQVRYGDAVRFEWDVSKESLALRIPHLLLQPLLENAIEHGALQRQGGGTVTLKIGTSDGKLRIVVGDDGPGMPDGRAAGLGLRLTSDRLRVAYPGTALDVRSTGAGTTVTVVLPTVEGAR